MRNLIIKIARAPAPDVYYEVYGEEADNAYGEKYYFYAVNKEEDDASKAVLTSSLYVSIAECAAAAVELLPLCRFSKEWEGHEGIVSLPIEKGLEEDVRRVEGRYTSMLYNFGDDEISADLQDSISENIDNLNEAVYEIRFMRKLAMTIELNLEE